MASTTESHGSTAARLERRRSARFTLETLDPNGISFGTGSSENRGVVLNLSDDGLAVHTAAPPGLGSTMRLRWELFQPAALESEGAVMRADKASGSFRIEFRNLSEHIESVEAEGTIVWVDKEKQCCGVYFHNLSEQAEHSIGRWVKHRASAPHSASPNSKPLAAPPLRLVSDTTRDRLSTEEIAAMVRVPPASPMVTGERVSLPPAPAPWVAPAVRRDRWLWTTVAAIIVLLLLIFLAVGAYWGANPRIADKLGFGSGVAAAPILRLAGSNTIGEKLAPALVQAFMKQLGASDIRLMPGKKGDEEAVQAIMPGATSPVEIQIAAHGSATAFDGLMGASCEIGMASRKIKPEEVTRLSSLGDLSAPASEHVLGLDGIAVIVSSSNPVQMLTKDQLAGIFSGKVTNWSEVNGQPGAIHIYARDDNSGTYDTFKTLVLGSTPLADTAKRFEDSQALSDGVAGDPNGIGFIGLPYILSAKAIAVAERGATPFQPNRLTVGTEDYPLSRRLYLYTPPNPQNSYVRRFVEFALSKAGQEVVGQVGFVAQNVVAEQAVIAPNAPYQYRRLTQGAGRLSLDFRFLPGLTTLDNKALMDLDRVVSFLAESGYSGNNVMLFGFADNIGNSRANYAIAQSRARMVAEEFTRRGLNPATVVGFGPDLPVGSNDTDAGRERNRRVEIWLKK